MSKNYKSTWLVLLISWKKKYILHKISILFVEFWIEILKYYFFNLDYSNIAWNIWNCLGMIQHPCQHSLSLTYHHSGNGKGKINLGHCMPLQISLMSTYQETPKSTWGGESIYLNQTKHQYFLFVRVCVILSCNFFLLLPCFILHIFFCCWWD